MNETKQEFLEVKKMEKCQNCDKFIGNGTPNYIYYCAYHKTTICGFCARNHHMKKECELQKVIK